MERIYEIEQCDNGWILRDDDAIAHQVCQEKESDNEHHKFKKTLGEWIYEDLHDFFREHEVVSAKLTLKFEETD